MQASRWRIIAENHLTNIYDEIENSVKAALEHIIKESHIQSELWEITKLSLQRSKHAAEDELSKVCEDEKQQPITYSHYYTNNVQNSRQDAARKLIKKAMNEASAHDWNGKLHISNNAVDAEKLLASLQKRITIDMDAQACTEALAGLSAYYKVSSPPLDESRTMLIGSGGSENIRRQRLPAGD